MHPVSVFRIVIVPILSDVRADIICLSFGEQQIPCIDMSDPDAQLSCFSKLYITFPVSVSNIFIIPLTMQAICLKFGDRQINCDFRLSPSNLRIRSPVSISHIFTVLYTQLTDPFFTQSQVFTIK